MPKARLAWTSPRHPSSLKMSKISILVMLIVSDTRPLYKALAAKARINTVVVAGDFCLALRALLEGVMIV